jgi:hypothetical protein
MGLTSREVLGLSQPEWMGRRGRWWPGRLGFERQTLLKTTRERD